MILSKNEKKNLIRKIIHIFFMALICVIFILKNTTDSPLLETAQWADSAVFMTIARGILEGKIPYRDMFDHKGPLIYLINVIALLITNKYVSGLWIVELIFLFISTILIYKTTNSILENEKYNIFGLFVATLYVFTIQSTNMLEFGNFTEEYAQPFIFFSLYIFIKYIKSSKVEHKPEYMLIHGIMCGCCLMLRMNLISIWVSLGIFIIIKLISNKKYKNLIFNLIYGILGVLMFILPFIVYFAVNNALNEMVYCNIIFSFSYSNVGYYQKLNAIMGLISINKLLLLMNMAAIELSVFKDFKNKVWVFLIIFLVISFLFAGYSGRYYLHYSLAVLPPLILGVMLICKNLLNILDKNNNLLYIYIITGILILLMMIMMCIPYYTDRFYHYMNKKRTSDMFIEEMGNIENEKIYVLGNECRYYILLNKIPDVKYIYNYIYDMPVDSMEIEARNYIINSKPKYIIVHKYCNQKLYELVKQNYSLIIETDEELLYIINNEKELK